MVEITGHRDHARLEVSVISALHQLGKAREVWALEVITLGEELHVRPKASIQAEQLLVDDVEHGQGESLPIEAYPALLTCIKDCKDSLEVTDGPHGYELWLPVWLDKKVVACLEIRNDHSFTPEMLGVIHGIFNVYRNYQSLLDYSERDALTGLFNRKTFDAEFGRPSPVSLNSNTSPENDSDLPQTWLAVIDIDHFKQVNDRFGHLYGDEVLILMANLLRSSFRSNDRIFRFGGEEFVILLRMATRDLAHQVFNRFRATVEAHHFPQVGSVTVSLGFVNAGHGAAVENLGHADEALYYAKTHGRNRVCEYEDLVARGELAKPPDIEDDLEVF